MDELERNVVQLIARTGSLDAGSISLESSFEELGIDSLEAANILFAVEDDFDIYIAYEPRELTGFTVGMAAEAVRRLVAEKVAADGSATPG